MSCSGDAEFKRLQKTLKEILVELQSIKQYICQQQATATSTAILDNNGRSVIPPTTCPCTTTQGNQQRKKDMSNLKINLECCIPGVLEKVLNKQDSYRDILQISNSRPKVRISDNRCTKSFNTYETETYENKESCENEQVNMKKQEQLLIQKYYSKLGLSEAAKDLILNCKPPSENCTTPPKAKAKSTEKCCSGKSSRTKNAIQKIENVENIYQRAYGQKSQETDGTVSGSNQTSSHMIINLGRLSCQTENERESDTGESVNCTLESTTKKDSCSAKASYICGSSQYKPYNNKDQSACSKNCANKYNYKELSASNKSYFDQLQNQKMFQN